MSSGCVLCGSADTNQKVLYRNQTMVFLQIEQQQRR
jgi:hypothetical protein